MSNTIPAHGDMYTAAARRGGVHAHLLTSRPASPSAHAASPLELGNTETTQDTKDSAGSEHGKCLALLGMKALWKFARSKSLQECHRAPNPQYLEQSIDSNGSVIGLCNSHNRLSPMAAKKIFQDESLDMQAATLAWTRAARAHDVGMLTLTVRHYAGDSLEWLLDSLQESWDRFNRTGKRGVWARLKERFGIETWRWSLESNHSFKNGHHPHRHMLLFFNRRLSAQEVRELETLMFEEWNKHVMRVMGRSLVIENPEPGEKPQHAVDIRLASRDGAQGLAQYITKGMALEATGGIQKTGRGGSRTPHEILVALATTPRARDLAVFREMETAFRGVRWTGKAQNFVPLMDSLGWREIRAELESKWKSETGELVERYILVSLEAGEWKKLSRDIERRALIQETVKAAGMTVHERYAVLTELLDSWGIRYRRVMLPAEEYETVRPSAANSSWLAGDAHAVVSPGSLPRPGGSVSIAA